MPSSLIPASEAGCASAVTAAQPTSPTDATFAAVTSDTAEARTITLENDFIAVNFTDHGGAIRDIGLKKYDADQSRPGVPYLVNRLHADPALAFVDLPGLDRHARELRREFGARTGGDRPVGSLSPSEPHALPAL